MRKKATKFEIETIGIPKLENIPKDILDAIVHTLELQMSESVLSKNNNIDSPIITVNPD